jgi:hypothetical protein
MTSLTRIASTSLSVAFSRRVCASAADVAAISLLRLLEQALLDDAAAFNPCNVGRICLKSTPHELDKEPAIGPEYAITSFTIR